MTMSKPLDRPFRSADAPAQPAKHRAIATALTDAIQGGRFLAGDRLPSEPALSRQFGVSRHTVRAALRTLQDKGLVASRQGLGTIVQAPPAEPRFSYHLESIDDLLQYAAATPRTVRAARRVTANGPRADWLGCAPGTVWWTVRTRRVEAGSGRAIASSTIYVPDRYGAALVQARDSALPVFVLLERGFGVRIAEVRQVLSVTTASTTEARDLRLRPGDAVMAIERRFLDAQGRLAEVSRSVHPGADFRYELKVALTER